MKKNLLLLLLALALLGGCKSDDVVDNIKPPVIEEPGGNTDPDGDQDPDEDLDEVAKQILNADWEITEVSPTVTWKYYHFNSLFTARQSVTIIDVDLNDESLTIDIPYVEAGFLKTSEGAARVRATAAINGSFFDTKDGGSTVFFKKNGEIINYTRSGFTPYRENAGFAMDEEGNVFISKRPTSGWENVEAHTLLASGPLLVFGGNEINQIANDFNTTRHPRTAVGVTADNHLIAVVVDGRATQSDGMSTEELAKLMHTLGCTEAMNLDGGGSSTAWITKKGVVNYPTDNKKFDHEGERGVATVITFVEK